MKTACRWGAISAAAPDKGRLGIHELMNGSPAIKRMIKKQASAEELFIQAKKKG
ncbi:MAG: hypothetical protein R2875_12855 [Desulfobacterales bacterium]